MTEILLAVKAFLIAGSVSFAVIALKMRRVYGHLDWTMLGKIYGTVAILCVLVLWLVSMVTP